MTCADKLRDLHAAGKFPDSSDWRSQSVSVRRAALRAYDALPEIAAVIEAGRVVRHANIFEIVAACEAYDEAEAALARRLETQP